MREIEFRGKSVGRGDWVFGNLIGKDYIVGEIVEFDNDGFCTEFWWKVDPETVGQYTGLPDRDKNDIFENDIIDGSYINKMTNELVRCFYLVVFKNGRYIAKLIGKSPYGDTLLYFINEKYKVISNIHDNPHLLEVDKR